MTHVPKIVWPLIGIFSVFAVVAFFLYKKPDVAMVPSKVHDLMPGETLKIKDIKYDQDYNNGEEKWELKAKEGRVLQKEQVVALRNVSFTLCPYKSDPVTIKGREGSYFRDKGRVIIKGDVKGKSGENYRINTDLLIFRQENNSIDTDKYVSIAGPFFLINGYGLFVDLRGKKFRVRRNVHTTLWMEEMLER